MLNKIEQQNVARPLPVVSTITLADLLSPFGLDAAKIKFLEFLLSRKGQFMAVDWRRNLQTRKDVTSMVEKQVHCVCRAGISYDNQAIVQEKRESGELPAENAGLPWGTWLSFPYVIQHQSKNAAAPELYVRLYPSRLPEHGQVKAWYYLNGVEIDKETALPLCLASEWRESQAAECFTVKLNNVLTEQWAAASMVR